MKKLYSDKWFEIVGTLGNMDSEGNYFSMEGPAFSLISGFQAIKRKSLQIN